MHSAIFDSPNSSLKGRVIPNPQVVPKPDNRTRHVVGRCCGSPAAATLTKVTKLDHDDDFCRSPRSLLCVVLAGPAVVLSSGVLDDSDWIGALLCHAEFSALLIGVVELHQHKRPTACRRRPRCG